MTSLVRNPTAPARIRGIDVARARNAPGVMAVVTGSDVEGAMRPLPAAALTTPELKGLAEHTLACSDTAGRIAAEAGVKRLVLTHFRSMTPAMLAELERDVRRDFDGPVALARDLDEFVV
jgi:CO/xanthine dehydrogenase Mo-binding subunit